MPRDLRDSVMIITGASSGIGAATAVEAARAGMRVVISARRADRLRETAALVRDAGSEAEIVTGDVCEPDMAGRLLDAASARFGRFDAVFANAGYGLGRAVHEMSEADLRAMFETNFFAATFLLQHAARRLIADARPGHLLMCSSALSKFAVPCGAVYSATKAAQNHICRGMRAELRPHRIQVSSVHPVGTRTEFFKASRRRSGTTPRETREDDPATSRTPQLFMQSPQRVARAVIRCLRSPKPEVWTSRVALLGAGIITALPRSADAILRVAGVTKPR